MTKPFVTLCVSIAMLAGSALAVHGIAAEAQSAPAIPAAQSAPTVILALTDAQYQQCQAEAQSLNQQLAQCGSDQSCRANLQAAIAAHNSRCQ